MDQKAVHKQYQRSNSEEIEINAELFYIIRKRNISIKQKVKKVKKLLGKNPQPDINAQDGNDNCNTALHMAIKRNELELVNCLLSEGADTSITNGDGKTPLQLAVGCNHAEIIDALKSCTSYVELTPSQIEILAPHNPQPVAANTNEQSVSHSNSHAAATGKQTASTVLPPFSGKLREDKQLNLSHGDFKQKIKTFHENKQISAIDQLKATPAYPTPHVLAQFASMAYKDFKHGDPKPPDGWKLLTTASHFGMTNGYFGTAYWHPEHQQVVIAHRGTDITNVGALVTDFNGVVFNNYVNQMSSASTFANKVVSVLQEIEQEKKVSYELFFTGHSLGGWLAQITTFTAEYLEVKGGTFLKKLKRERDGTLGSSTVQDSHVIKESYHPHTRVFDSPGCKDMLSKMADKFDVRLHGSSIDLQHLDITSYLSAPNRINTCNTHVGTVYRIFTDLSDMGFFRKHTPLYNLATHRMDKIVEAFDPETGQVCKDDEGEPKIRQVVDWPVSAGLTGGAELNNFFEWAKHLNNFHPQVMDISHSNVPKGYHPLRYQTKAYDECTKCLSSFTKDEREFLESYRWLRHMPDFFKPEDLFSVWNDAEAEKDAEQKLGNFEIGNENIRCPAADTLHTLLPYVKRLVRLFTHIKEKVKEKLSAVQIRNRVYQYETERYVAKITQNELQFNAGALGLTEFLISDQQTCQLRMIDGDAWTGLTEVYRVLQNTSCTPSFSSKGHYTILKLKRLLTVNRMISLNALLTSIETPHLLMIACGANQTVNGELENMFQEMFSILKQKKDLKIILITQSEIDFSALIEQIATETLGEGFTTTDVQLTWSDLTESSKRKMLEKTVLLQGRSVALNQLTSAESVADFFPLAALLHGKVLTIGEGSVQSGSSGYNEKYYIDRTFNHNIVIREDILSDKKEEKFVDLLASAEQEFKQLCQQNPNRNVHWLEKGKSEELIWQQSQGDLKTLSKYIDAHKSHSYAPGDLGKLLQQAKHKKVMLIADKAGMGKSTVLTHLSKRIMEIFQGHWLVRIDLNDYTGLLKAQKGKEMDKEKVLEFISKEVLKLESDLEKELFKKCFEGNEINKVVVMVDGFDEISPLYKETVIDMLQVLKLTISLEQLWVTTRPHLREELEDNLQQLSYTLQPFSEVEQVEFLNKFWLQKLNLEPTNQDRLQIYAEALIRNLAQSVSDKDKEFTGIPLQTRMLAEAFEQEFISFYWSEKSEPEFPHKLDLLGLYRLFIERKYDIHDEEKCKIPAGNVAIEVYRQNFVKQLQEKHELLALEALFTEEQLKSLQINYQSTLSDEDLARIGIVQKDQESKPQFIHRTFAEYFVAEFLIKQLTNKNEQHTQVQDFLLNEVLIQADCEVIRAFLDGLLEKNLPSVQALRDCGEKLDKQWRQTDGTTVTTALHQAAAEDNEHIVGFLLDSLKSGEYSRAIKEMLLEQGVFGQTAVHMAVSTGSVQALKKIWDWAQAVTPTLPYILLLSQNTDSKTAWQLAAEGGHIKVVQKLWNWAKEAQMTPGGLQNKLLLNQDLEGRTAWYVAAQRGSVELRDRLWSWAKKLLLSRDLLKNKLLLSRDKNGISAWHLAAKTGNVVRLDKLWDWAKELQLEPEELRNELLLSKDKSEQTAWQMAAEGGHVEVLERLWEWAKEEKLNPHYLKSALFLSEDSHGFSTWRCAVYNGHIHVIQTLWGWAEELQLTANELNKLILAVDKGGNTAIYWAACTGSIELLDKLWAVCKETQLNPDELSKLLVAAWHEAAAQGYLEILERVWLWAGEVQLNTQQLQRRLLLEQNKDGESAWNMAAAGGHIEVLEKLWDWAKGEQINSDNFKSLLFVPEDSCSFSSWCYAIRHVRRDVIQKLWGWAEELQLTPDEIKNKLFLAADRDGNTAIYWAAYTGSIESLEKLWGLSKETQLNTDELSKLLVAAWHAAAARGYLEILERVWLWAGEGRLKQHELQIRLLLETNKNASSAWYSAVAGGHVEVLEKLWDWAKEVQINREELKDTVLLDEHQDRKFSLHLAVKGDNEEISDNLVGSSQEAQIKADDIRSVMLLAMDKHGESAWHLAVRNGRIMVLQKLLDWAKDMGLNPGEVRNKLFLDQEEDGRTAWFLAAKSVNVEILEEVWVLAKAKGKPKEINSKLLLAQNEHGQTALHLTAEGSVAVLKKLWDFAKEVELNKDEMKNQLLLAKDKSGNTVWHRAAEGGSLETLETLWDWAKEAEINPAEILLTQNEERETIYHLAAERNDEGMLNKMRIFAREVQVNSKEMKIKLLLVKDKAGNTAWHRAAKRDSSEAFEILWNCAKEVELNTHELLLDKEKQGKDSPQVASQKNKLGISEEQLVVQNEKKIYETQFKKRLVLDKNMYGYTVWHIAAEEGNLETLEILWKWANELELNTDELLLAKARDGFTALKLEAENNHVEILTRMSDWAEEIQFNTNELKKKLLLTKDSDGQTTWHRAALQGSLETLEILWSLAKEAKLNPDELLLAQNVNGNTAFQLAARRNNVEILNRMWVWAEEMQINPNELKIKLLLTEDKYGYTAWHEAALQGSLETLEILWSLAKEAKLNTDELLLSQTMVGNTAFQLAVGRNNVEILNRMWVWAEETQPNPNDLKIKLLLTTDYFGYTAWHYAADQGSLETLEVLWSLAKEAKLNTDELLLAQNENGNTAFQLAAGRNNVEILNKLWVWAEEMQLNPNELKN